MMGKVTERVAIFKTAALVLSLCLLFFLKYSKDQDTRGPSRVELHYHHQGGKISEFDAPGEKSASDGLLTAPSLPSQIPPYRKSVLIQERTKILRFLWTGSWVEMGLKAGKQELEVPSLGRGAEFAEGRVVVEGGPGASGFYMCPRPWVSEFLVQAATSSVHHSAARPPAPRSKMGEVRQWMAVLRSLAGLGCDIRLALPMNFTSKSTTSSYCPSVEEFFLAKGNKGARGRRFLIIEDLETRPLTQTDHCRALKRGTVVLAWEKSPVVPPHRTLSAFKDPSVFESVGIDATCPARKERRAWFGLLWGKRKQEGWHQVISPLEPVAALVPVVATCFNGCQSITERGLVHNLGPISKSQYDVLLAKSVFILGLNAPVSGATVAEALACGTPVIARRTSVPSEFHKNPLVYLIPSSQTKEAVTKTIRTVLRERYGYDEDLHALNQSHPPLETASNRNSSLPQRYSHEGHRKNIASIFGLDDSCRPLHHSSEDDDDDQAPIRKILATDWDPKCRH